MEYYFFMPRLALALVGTVLLGCHPASAGMVSSNVDTSSTILAIFAHPDDELAVSPLLARYAREGVDVYLVIATDGRKGVREHAGIPAGDQLAARRAEEARCACRELGIHEPILLGLADGSLASADTLRLLHQAIARLLEEIQPDVILTWGPDGGYGHPDHRMVSNVVTEVYQRGMENLAGSLYYAATPTEGFANLPAASTFVGQWLSRGLHPTAKRYLPVRIAYADENLEAAHTSYKCHMSQYTEEEIDEIFALLRHVQAGTVYLRPWFGDETMRTDLFD